MFDYCNRERFCIGPMLGIEFGSSGSRQAIAIIFRLFLTLIYWREFYYKKSQENIRSNYSDNYGIEENYIDKN